MAVLVVLTVVCFFAFVVRQLVRASRKVNGHVRDLQRRIPAPNQTATPAPKETHTA